MSRPSEKDYYLMIAKAVSARSTCLRRQYGAVVVNNKEIISTGYNGSIRGASNCCDIYDVCPRADKPHNSGDYSDCCAVHAEQNALLSASRRDMIGGTIYLFGTENGKDLEDLAPCPICMKLIINAGLEKIVTPNKTWYFDNEISIE